MEQEIRDIIARVLNVSNEEVNQLGLDDDLIEFGVDSMNSIEIIVEMEELFHISIDVEDLTIDSIGSLRSLMKLTE